MSGKIVSGTIRARRGDTYLLVKSNGDQVFVALEGIENPKIGVDVIGMMTNDEMPRMRLVPDVTRTLLRGKSKIVPAGRPEVTARMLANLLVGTGISNIRPGTGGMIDRTPEFSDPDVKWAIDMVRPLMDTMGVALNVIDPISLAKSPWDDSYLKEHILPADIAGEDQALKEFKALIKSGLPPTCNKTITAIGRGLITPSVNFILPYSPFATGQSWSADIAHAWRDEYVMMSLSGADARRLSTFQEIAKAVSDKYLGQSKSRFSSHQEQAFADAAASIAFLKAGGDTASVYRFQRLREAALSRWNGSLPCPPATFEAIGSAMEVFKMNEIESAEQIFQLSASIAKSTSPKTEAKLKALQKVASSDGVIADISDQSPDFKEGLKRSFELDLRLTVERLDNNETAIKRMSGFEFLLIPEGFSDVKERVVGIQRADDEESFQLEEDFIPSI